jgi:iron complex outermembrane receptor protein
MGKSVERHVASILGGTALIISAASAQVATPPAPANEQIETITVTAQKRSQAAQDIPLAVSAFDSQTLKTLGIKESNEIAEFIPNLEIGTPSGKGNQPIITIRGVGLNDYNTNNAGPNGVYVDEVYQASPASQTFQTFDIDRLEVLKGPQGTLYGRNTTGGAINYITEKPSSDFFASEDLSYGSWNSWQTETVINGAITADINGRLAVVHNGSDGWLENEINGKTENGANDTEYRAQLAIRANEELKFLINFHGANVDRRPDEYHEVGTLNPATGLECSASQISGGQCVDAYGYHPPSSLYKGNYNRDQNLQVNAYGGSIRADYDLGGVTLTSISSLETSKKIHPEDSDAEPFELLEINYGVNSTDIQQEFRASGGTDLFHWVGGLYYLNEHLHQDQPISVFADVDSVVGVPGAGDGFAQKAEILNNQITQSYAAYGQADYQIFDRTRLTLGARYTFDHKSFQAAAFQAFETNGVIGPLQNNYHFVDSLDDGAFSWRAALDYHITPDILAYGSISTGYKSGGFNGGFLDNAASNALLQLTPIQPEDITAYEIGLKSDWFDKRLQINLAAFYYDYHNLQIYNLLPGPANGGLPINVLSNAPNATIQGAEFQGVAKPFENFTVSANIGLLDTYLGTFVAGAGTADAVSYTGHRFPLSPKFSSEEQFDYRLPMPNDAYIDANTTVSYRSKQFFDSANDPLIAQPGYWLLDARVTYATGDGRWEFSVIGKNLSGTKYLNDAFDLTSPFGLLEEIVGHRASSAARSSTCFSGGAAMAGYRRSIDRRQGFWMSNEPPRNRHAGWVQRQAEMDKAAAADAATVARERDAASERTSVGYASPLAMLVGFAIVAGLVVLGLYIVVRLEHDPLSSDCAAAHGNRC